MLVTMMMVFIVLFTLFFTLRLVLLLRLLALLRRWSLLMPSRPRIVLPSPKTAEADNTAENGCQKVAKKPVFAFTMLHLCVFCFLF